MTFLANLRPLFLLLVLSTLLASCDSSNDEDPPPVMFPPPRVVAEADYTVTASGLKIFDIVVGTGSVAENGNRLVVDYTGWLEDGTVFDSSLLRQQPITFTVGVGQVISGWEEGLLNMRVGGQRQLVIPPQLAYGALGRGPIPPNATLIFEVEFLGITGTASP